MAFDGTQLTSDTDDWNFVTPLVGTNGFPERSAAVISCEWTLKAPSTAGTFDLMGEFMYGAANPTAESKINASQTFTVSAPVPEFPLGLGVAFLLSLSAYAYLRRQRIDAQL
jgi:hypothetical protein